MLTIEQLVAEELQKMLKEQDDANFPTFGDRINLDINEIDNSNQNNK